MAMRIDPNWTNGGNDSGDETYARPALARVWQGRILAAYQSSTLTNGAGPLYLRCYDPYPGSAQGWAAGATTLESISIVGGPALAYAGLYAYVFYGDPKSGLSYCPIFMPPIGTSDHAVQYGGPFTGTPRATGNGLASGIAAAVYNGCIYVAWLGATSGVYGGSLVYYASAPLGTAPALNFSEAVILSPPDVPTAFSELSLTVFNGKLYCFYQQHDGTVQALTIDPNGVVAVLSPLDQNGNPLACSYAPTVTTDPSGLYLMALFAGANQTQIYSSYLRIDSTGNQWGLAQQVGTQETNCSPAVVATPTGYAYLFSKRTDGTHTNLCLSNPLPMIYNFGES